MRLIRAELPANIAVVCAQQQGVAFAAEYLCEASVMLGLAVAIRRSAVFAVVFVDEIEKMTRLLSSGG